MHSLSANLPDTTAEETKAGSSQNRRASTSRFSSSRASSAMSTPVSPPAGFTRKQTMLRVAGLRHSSTGLASMYASARAAESIPCEMLSRNAAIPNVCTDIQILSARAERLICSPRSTMFGCPDPHRESWRKVGRISNGSSSVDTSRTSRQPTS